MKPWRPAKRPPRPWLRAVLAAVLALLFCAAPASAQKEARPPEAKTPLLQWATVLLGSGFIIAIAFKNPRRTHQT